MRNSLQILVITAAVLTACGKEQAAPVPEAPAEVAFRVNATTKAYSETVLNTLKTGGFSVTARYASDGSVFCDNLTASWNEDASLFRFTPSRYWPETAATVNFFAASRAISLSGTTPVLSYTQSGEAWSGDPVAAYASASSGTVSLDFKHILAKVGSVKVAITDDGTLDFTVDTIRVTSPATGTYDIAAGTWTAGATETRIIYIGTSASSCSAPCEVEDGMTVTLTPGTEPETRSGSQTLYPTTETYVPGTLVYTVSFHASYKSGGTLFGKYRKNATFTLTKGQNVTVTLNI